MKKIWVGMIAVIVVVLMVGGGFFYHQHQEKQKQEAKEQAILLEIKNSYAPIVSTMKAKEIFLFQEGSYQKVGLLEAGVTFSLVEKEITGIEDIYYQVKDSNYYVDYHDLKKEETFLSIPDFSSYVVTNQIHTIPTRLYQDGKVMISLEEEHTFDVLYQEDEKYYVSFLGSIYYIQDSYQLEEKKYVETLKEISVFNFSDDISLEQLEKVLQFFKENQYESISILDFQRWVHKQASLGKNKILLLCYQELDEKKKEVAARYGYQINTSFSDIQFVSGDTKLKVGDTKYYKYEIYSTTSLNRIQDMLNGIPEVTQQTVPKVTVLNYHFFYDSSSGESCNESICLDVKNFREQLTYLTENHYKILTMNEFNDWMDKKITLPEKSVLITVDDGAMGTSFINGNKLIPILEEFQIPATLFLITGWWDVANYQSSYLEIHSHGDELHHDYYCNASGKCGYKGLVLTKEEIKTDLETSIAKIGSNFAFCFPFYQSSNTMVEALKETGYQLAFVGGNRKVKQSDNKYAVPRYVVYKNTSLASFIKMVSPS